VAAFCAAVTALTPWAQFLRDDLELDLSPDKTLITHGRTQGSEDPSAARPTVGTVAMWLMRSSPTVASHVSMTPSMGTVTTCPSTSTSSTIWARTVCSMSVAGQDAWHYCSPRLAVPS
jgi:hypothetical protein